MTIIWGIVVQTEAVLRWLEEMRRRGHMEGLELRFSELLTRLAQAPSEELALAAWLVCRRQIEGHSCVPLRSCAGQVLGGGTEGTAQQSLRAPPLEVWCAALDASGMVDLLADAPGPGSGDKAQQRQLAPLVLDAGQRLYLRRYWQYEKHIAAQLLARAARQIPSAIAEQQLAQQLAAQFPADEQDTGQPVWQRVAAAIFLLRGLCVISGGPGTGKTTAMAGILRILLRNTKTPQRIALAAPTGKAARRMQPILRELRADQELPEHQRSALPEEPFTLHRLLGQSRSGGTYRHNRAELLPLDVLVVDECSMIDSALMAHLLNALSAQARLLLLGDHHQLAAVESGAVLGDLCSHLPDAAPPFRQQLEALAGCRLPPRENTPDDSPLRDTIVIFQRNYRFAARSSIGRLAQAVKNGSVQQSLQLLHDSNAHDDAELHHDECATPAALAQLLRKHMKKDFLPYLNSLRQHPCDAAQVLQALQKFRVLAATHGGPYGVRRLNAHISALLRREGAFGKEEGPWYHGRAVLILENNYFLQLFNGDTGVCLRDPTANNALRVFFPLPDGGVRNITPARLPHHDTAFAMTVHKSQGAEFDHILLVLPNTPDHPLLVRELLYTGLSRARHRLHLCAPRACLSNAVLRRYERASGLRERLGAGHSG